MVTSHFRLAPTLRSGRPRGACGRPILGDPMRFLRFPRLVLILAALGPSCGGGGSSPSAPANPTTTTTTVPPVTAAADLVISILGDQGGMSFSPATATLRVG